MTFTFNLSVFVHGMIYATVAICSIFFTVYFSLSNNQTILYKSWVKTVVVKGILGKLHMHSIHI